MRRLMFFIVAAAIPLVEAQAQIPANTLVTGQSQPARAQATPGGPWCFVGRGLSAFQGNASGTEAVVSLPEVTYFDGTSYYLLDGQARLDFTTASTGNIKFKLTSELPFVSNKTAILQLYRDGWKPSQPDLAFLFGEFSELYSARFYSLRNRMSQGCRNRSL